MPLSECRSLLANHEICGRSTTKDSTPMTTVYLRNRFDPDHPWLARGNYSWIGPPMDAYKKSICPATVGAFFGPKKNSKKPSARRIHIFHGRLGLLEFWPPNFKNRYFWGPYLIGHFASEISWSNNPYWHSRFGRSPLGLGANWGSFHVLVEG